jgi:serine/threonine-protein kinase RsbW
MKLELNATPEEVMRAVEVLQAFSCDEGLAERDVFGLALALEECASNIVNHAYRGDSRQKFTVAIERLPDRLLVETRDRGPAFNPLTVPPPRVDLESDDLALGGVGIYLARHYLDELAYAREGGENVLRLTKFLPPEAAKSFDKQPK